MARGVGFGAKNNENNCECYGRNKGTHSEQVPNRNFYFLAFVAYLLVFLV